MLTQKDIDNFILRRPHIVILGAGATMAAIPNGDLYGNPCSVMNGFIETTGVVKYLKNITLKTTSNNLEDIYSELYDRPEYKIIRHNLEEGIVDYLSHLILPDTPTIYDFLVLSLRKKDIIFSFNWDDLLIQAYRRVWNFTQDLPELVFLHGNVGVGRCPNCGRIETYTNYYCHECHTALARPKILFPVAKKDYTSDDYIRDSWQFFEDNLANCSLLTIFGYGAPSSDAAAVSLMEKSFSSTFRRFDRIEIIDIKPESEIRRTWSHFIDTTNDHCNVYNNYFESLIAEFPRRSIEGYHRRYFKSWFGEGTFALNNVTTFDDLERIIRPIIDNESGIGFADVLFPT